MKSTNKTMKLALGGAFAATILVIPALTSAEENPFFLQSLSSGYMVAEQQGDKMKEGNCAADKAKEGNCAADKAKEGSCSADKMKEGNCAADKTKEGNCAANKG